MGLLMCPICRKALPSDSKICPVCGKNILSYEKLFCKNCSGELLLRCPKCGKNVGAKTDSCDSCGYDMKKARRIICSCCDKKNSVDIIPSSYTCKYCGKIIKKTDSFCPVCGTPVKEISYCAKCNAKLSPGNNFCPSCGWNVYAKSNSVIRRKRIGHKFHMVITRKRVVVLCLLLVLTVLLCFSWKKWISPMFVSTEKWLEQGNYEMAYKKADEDEKQDVLIENLIIDLCNARIDYMNDSESFNLRKGWIDVEGGDLVLLVGGKNAFGGSVINMLTFTYIQSKKEYTFLGSSSDLDTEEINRWDDTSEMVDKIADNIVKVFTKATIENGEQIKNSTIKNINNLHKNGKLDSIELLDEVKTIYPSDEENA